MKMESKKPTSFQPKPLDDNWSKWLIGGWEGSAESDVGIAKVWMKIYYGLNGQFLIIESESQTTEIGDKHRQYYKEVLGVSDKEIEKSLNSNFKGLQIFTADPATDDVVGYLFDSLRCVAKGKGSRQENTEVIEWIWSESGEGATSVTTTNKISDNEFTLNHKYILPNGKSMEDTIEMHRKQLKKIEITEQGAALGGDSATLYPRQ